MSEVSLMIHGRSYGVGCDDGQEKRVRELGQYIDKKVKEISGAGGAATEAHLLVLACLVMADELFETREGIQSIRAQMTAQTREIDNLQNQLTQMAANADVAPAAVQTDETSDFDPEVEAQITGAIANLSMRLEGIAKRLQAA